MLSNIFAQQAKLTMTSLYLPHYSNRFTDQQGPMGVPGARLASTTRTTKKTTLASEIPKRPPAARMLFLSDFFSKQKFANNTERLKAGNDAWKALSDAEKQRYETARVKGMAKFETDMKSWLQKMTAQGHEDLLPEKERAKVAADLGKPKRPLSPFLRYAMAQKVAGKSVTEHTRAAGEAWNKMSDKEKQQYAAGYDAEMEKYKKDISAWRAKMAATGHINILPVSTRKAELKKVNEKKKK